mgnify:CR=1 FL=1|tara:strand:+ start:131 stop:535 length:405 start_codon:yes stop_codon:yes gene_type:complete
MATNKRTYPNDNFAWYNDDKRVAILCLETSSDTTERTREPYDTYKDSDISNGLRITYHSKYEAITTGNLGNEMSSQIGLDTGMQNALLCYVKARLFEDQGDLQQAQYFRQMYDKSVKQYPSRKSGVRQLSVPRL